MESHSLEGTSKVHLPNAVLVRTGCLGPCSVLPISKDGHPTACLDSLFQCLTILTVIIFPYTSLEFPVLNLPSFSVHLWEVWLHLLYNLPINSFLKLNNPISFCLSLHIIISSPKNILVALHQTHFSMPMSFMYRWTQNRTQYSRFQKCWIEQKDGCLGPAGCILANKVEDAVGLLSFKDTLLVHVVVHQDSQV